MVDCRYNNLRLGYASDECRYINPQRGHDLAIFRYINPQSGHVSAYKAPKRTRFGLLSVHKFLKGADLDACRYPNHEGTLRKKSGTSIPVNDTLWKVSCTSTSEEDTLWTLAGASIPEEDIYAWDIHRYIIPPGRDTLWTVAVHS